MSKDNKPTSEVDTTKQQTTSGGVAPRVFGSQAPTAKEQAESKEAAATQPKLDAPNGIAVPGDSEQQKELVAATTQLNALKQTDGAIHTGASNSTSSFKLDPAMESLVMPETEAGYYSMNAGTIKGKGGKVVKGIPTNRGFFYPADSSKEAKAALDSLVERGLAYVHKSSTK